MRAYIIILLFFVLVSADFRKTNFENPPAFSCGECDYVIKGYLTDGEKLNIRPGQILCFDAYFTYKSVRLENIKGSALEPVIIRNCGGVAVITEGLKFMTSENFKLLGDGVEGEKYGLKVSTHKSFYITFEKFTTDFEVARVEVAGYTPNGEGEHAGFAGIGIKTSPYQDCALFSDSTRQAWIMRNVSIHDNYIHDVGGEGLYIGHGFYGGRIEKDCPVKTYSHSIKGLRVHHNLIENTGFDGLQVKNADEDCEIYNNVIRNFGTRKHGAHNEGMLIADGVTGKVYNNLIDTGTGHGISFQGMGDNDIFNNIILNAGDDGFNGTGSKVGVYKPNGYYRIFNNTFYNSGGDGFVFFLSKGGEKRVMNNLVIKAKNKLNPKGAKLELLNNIFTQDSIVNILAGSLDNMILKQYVPCIDKGMDVRVFNPDFTFDFYNNPRPRGKAFDIGAIEFQ